MTVNLVSRGSFSFLFLVVCLLRGSFANPLPASGIVDFMEDFSAIPDDYSKKTCSTNSEKLTNALTNANNMKFRIPYGYTFCLTAGVIDVENVTDSQIILDGILRFKKFKHDKTNENYCIRISDSHNLIITSERGGVIDGRGSEYWGIPFIGYALVQEKRPLLLVFRHVTSLLVEGITLKDSPYHTMVLSSVDGVEIRNMSIVNRRTKAEYHSLIDLSAFNTDGIDVSGHNVYVHDVDIWTQDDCIAVKDHYGEDNLSSNMMFQRVNASGLGLTIGSIGATHVRNITFRDSFLQNSVKGVYLKFRNPDSDNDNNTGLTGLVEDILFDNITMEATKQWPIWIGPAQQSDTPNPCHANPCSLCWPQLPFTQCSVVTGSKFRNIVLKDVQINNGQQSPGMIMGDDKNTIENLTFDNVKVTSGKPVPQATNSLLVTFPGLNQPINDKYFLLNKFLMLLLAKPLMLLGKIGNSLRFLMPWKRRKRYYCCKGVENFVALDGTKPVPPCRKKERCG